MKQMKKVVASLAVLTLSLGLVACSSNKPVEEGSKKLVVYSPNSEGLMNAVIPLFEERYGITVEPIQAGTGELIKRIQAEKGDPQGDVMFGGAHSQYISNADLWEPYVSANEANIIEDYRNVSGFTTSYVLDGSVLLVNTDLIGDIKVEGYADLLNPELKGRIATADPANSSSAFAQLTNMLLAMGGYESDVAWDYVGALIKNWDGKILSGSSAVYKGVAEGEYLVGLTYEDPTAALVRDGAHVKIVYPKEGTVYLPATSGIIAGAKNMDNAKLFIDFLISKEVQDIFGSTLTNRPVMADATVGTYMTPINDIVRIEEDRDYVNGNKSAIVKRYSDLFSSLQ